MENLTTYPQSVKLKEIGVKAPSNYFWHNQVVTVPSMIILLAKEYDPINLYEPEELVPAYLLSELIEILGQELMSLHHHIPLNHNQSNWVACADDYVGDGNTPIEACYNLIIKLHEEGILVFNQK